MSNESLPSLDSDNQHTRQDTSTSLTTSQAPHSWLLRLFQSEFFNVRLAILYLYKYPTIMGIQNYICQELRGFEESEFMYASLGDPTVKALVKPISSTSHLLITNHTDAVCIETLLLEKCHLSAHIAMETLWYLEANFLEAQKNRPNSPSFSTAKRLVHHFHHCIFKPKNYFQPTALVSNRIRDHINPTLVGIGVLFAAFGCPQMYTSVQDVLKSQGQRSRVSSLAELPVLERTASEPQVSPNGVSPSSDPGTSLNQTVNNTNNNTNKESDTPRRSFEKVAKNVASTAIGSLQKLASRVQVSSASLEELSTGLAFNSKRRNPFTLRRPSQSSLTDPPSSLSPTDLNPNMSSYFYAQTQFLLTLVDISERLTSVPKAARQNTLIAELTLFNHNLPVEVCLPLWCSASIGDPRHHKIVRISPSDAVVLNSAERVPYLILVEVIDPTYSDHTPQESPRNSINESNGISSSPLKSLTKESAESGDLSGSLPLDFMEMPQKLLNQEMNGWLESQTSIVLPDAQSSNLSSTKSTKEEAELATAHTNKSPDASPAKIINPDEIDLRMRTAAVMLAQLYHQQNAQPLSQKSDSTNPSQLKPYFDDIRQKIISEMMELEAVRIASLESRLGDISLKSQLSSSPKPALKSDHEDPSAAVFKEPWKVKKERIRQSSPYGNEPNWRLLSVIVKTGADLRQEQLALQLIYEMSMIWKKANIPVWVYNFKILIMSDHSGLIETIQDAISVHSIKKQGMKLIANTDQKAYTLYDHFQHEYKDPVQYQKAQDCFMKSLVAYSLICYLLQIKDRHNGNILIDSQGHLIHIDFGFMLSNSPGSVGFELAPFKLPGEYIDILGGIGSPVYNSFVKLLTEAFIALRKKSDWIVGLVEIMEHGSRLPCFTGITKQPAPNSSERPSKSTQQTKHVSSALRDRFQLGLADSQIEEFVQKLVQSSMNSNFTMLYDTFQYYANDIL